MQESTEAPRLPNSDRADMNDIIEHLSTRADEDEQAARYSGEPGQWAVGECVSTDEPGLTEWEIVEAGSETVRARTLSNMRANHIARHDPARVLREVAALRQVINDYRAADRACMRGDAGSPEYATIRARRDAFKSVLRAYAEAAGWKPST